MNTDVNEMLSIAKVKLLNISLEKLCYIDFSLQWYKNVLAQGASHLLTITLLETLYI